MIGGEGFITERISEAFFVRKKYVGYQSIADVSHALSLFCVLPLLMLTSLFLVKSSLNLVFGCCPLAMSSSSCSSRHAARFFGLIWINKMEIYSKITDKKKMKSTRFLAYSFIFKLNFQIVHRILLSEQQ